ncbi:hypothetical protein MB27_04635 [Actinoplanes utahensis]|uniref:Uncharacterized protein n=1 Tax=Actinoplanes utahensis TaxID=1869 RepID=A0A0A6XEH0_ACTUT|nr:hypothetical protein MB27_04635 [Actinoplanes utahensis]
MASGRQCLQKMADECLENRPIDLNLIVDGLIDSTGDSQHFFYRSELGLEQLRHPQRRIPDHSPVNADVLTHINSTSP